MRIIVNREINEVNAYRLQKKVIKIKMTGIVLLIRKFVFRRDEFLKVQIGNFVYIFKSLYGEDFIKFREEIISLPRTNYRN